MNTTPTIGTNIGRKRQLATKQLLLCKLFRQSHLKKQVPNEQKGLKGFEGLL